MRKLDELLRTVDHKSYPAYKSLKGVYQFPKYRLFIDHVQGDPFAAPSAIRLEIPAKTHGISLEHYGQKHRRIMTQDYLLRKFAFQLKSFSKKAGGSGKSGILEVTRPRQEVLDRSAMQIDPATGTLTVRLLAGFPAAGRTTLSGELRKMLFEYLGAAVDKSLTGAAIRIKELDDRMVLADDQLAIRNALEVKGLIAFVGNGAILPRKSGVQDSPMEGAIPFKSPKEDEVEIELPGKRRIKGMGIPKGVTLIVGGGYHGKSTLLKALERGVYNHIPGDGREYVITEESAAKLREEDGRSIMDIDISPFIRDLPSKKDTVDFSTEDASGSTSQAAAVVEAYLSGSRSFLIDEDTSATNFLVRDELMAKVVHRDKEPIIPFLERMREFANMGISIVLVAGSSGAFFRVSDRVIQMDNYVPVDITERVREALGERAEKSEADRIDHRSVSEGTFVDQDKAERSTALDNIMLTIDRAVNSRNKEQDAELPDIVMSTKEPEDPQKNVKNDVSIDNIMSTRDGDIPALSFRKDPRIPMPNRELQGERRIKVRASGTDNVSLNHESIEVRFVEQLIDNEQTNLLAQLLKELQTKVFDGRTPLTDCLEKTWERLEKAGFSALFSSQDMPSNLAMARKQELYCMVNRSRSITLKK